MKEQSLADTPGRRAAAYWFLDGLPEIVAGAGLIALGGGLLWFHQLHTRSWSLRFAFLALALISLIVVFQGNQTISLFLKARLTFPRTGYVRPPAYFEPESARETILGLGLTGSQRPPDQNVTRFRTTTIGVVICGGQVLAGLIARPIGLPIAMTVVAVLLYVLHRGSERPYHWASVLPLPVAGLAAMYLRMGQDQNEWLVALFISGLWLTAQGTGRLLSYLRRYPHFEAVENLRP